MGELPLPQVDKLLLCLKAAHKMEAKTAYVGSLYNGWPPYDVTIYSLDNGGKLSLSLSLSPSSFGLFVAGR